MLRHEGTENARPVRVQNLRGRRQQTFRGGLAVEVENFAQTLAVYDPLAVLLVIKIGIARTSHQACTTEHHTFGTLRRSGEQPDRPNIWGALFNGAGRDQNIFPVLRFPVIGKAGLLENGAIVKQGGRVDALADRVDLAVNCAFQFDWIGEGTPPGGGFHSVVQGCEHIASRPLTRLLSRYLCDIGGGGRIVVHQAELGVQVIEAASYWDKLYSDVGMQLLEAGLDAREPRFGQLGRVHHVIGAIGDLDDRLFVSRGDGRARHSETRQYGRREQA